MLVLSRKSGEAIKIGNDITITVLGVRGRTLRLGIEAPRDSRVLRGELEDWNQPTSESHRGRIRAALAQR